MQFLVGSQTASSSQQRLEKAQKTQSYMAKTRLWIRKVLPYLLYRSCSQWKI